MQDPTRVMRRRVFRTCGGREDRRDRAGLSLWSGRVARERGAKRVEGGGGGGGGVCYYP